ncbi:MAG TPA: choice-of-anchor tandem repeat GloVer-containing protein [Candidatus Cybelea sp.]|nr:choice-of-anchor tandem repeat GloVer-containing protein [Candidatus Cybelea sp.]
MRHRRADVTTSDAENVLHSFTDGADGSEPLASLPNVNGTGYGTTETGGASNVGTVFKVTKSGKESILYSFAGGTVRTLLGV